MRILLGFDICVYDPEFFTIEWVRRNLCPLFWKLHILLNHLNLYFTCTKFLFLCVSEHFLASF